MSVDQPRRQQGMEKVLQSRNPATQTDAGLLLLQTFFPLSELGTHSMNKSQVPTIKYLVKDFERYEPQGHNEVSKMIKNISIVPTKLPQIEQAR